MHIFPFLLYAETHYRFKYFLSLYKKSEPEIISDAPHRLDPGQKYPIMILIKDADKYPVELHSVKVTVIHNAKKILTHTFEFAPSVRIHTRFWHSVLELPFSGTAASVFGLLYADVEIVATQKGKISVIRNNNHRFTSKAPLKFYRSKEHLPAVNGWIYGEAHSHSTYTEDQVEFGSPISAAVRLSQSMGLSFFGVTDHSYDLDDSTDNYLLNDPALPKWKSLHREIDAVNDTHRSFAVLRGEEVSCSNSENKNVHFLLYGNRRFFHGTGDGAEKWFQTQCEHTVQEVLSLKENDVVGFASHPTEEVSFLQKLLLKRNEWTVGDMLEKKLAGLQIMNGDTSDAFYRGMDIWKWMLLRGERKFVLAGNDAHGNFNRYIQISIPMVSFHEKETQLFGKMKTAVLTHSIDEQSIIKSFGAGRMVITNGPLLTISIETNAPDVGNIGDTVTGKKFVVKLHGATTSEFGQFRSVKVFYGIVGKDERLLIEIKQFSDPYAIHQISDWNHAETFSYIRAEAMTHKALGIDRSGFCYTNPIWIQP